MSTVSTKDSAGTEPYTIDDILRDRALTDTPPSFLAYPKKKDTSGGYEVLSTLDVDRLVDGAAETLTEHGFPPVLEEITVSIIGAPNLDYIITVLGLCRLGYTTLLLSPRLSIEAYLSLMSDTSSLSLLYASNVEKRAKEIQSAQGAKLMAILRREDYDARDHRSTFRHKAREPDDTFRKVFILHSSGSTKLPRPIHFTHERLIAACAPALGLKAFLTMPFFHTHGLCVFFQTLYTRATVYLFNSNIPQTCDNLVRAIKEAQPEIVYTVPYVLKLLAEKQDGIDALKTCKAVSYAGSRCPDELGDLLTSQGVRLGCVYGSTEVAMVFSSLSRPKDDTAWNYLRPVSYAAPYIFMKSVGDNIYELVVLDGHKAKTMSNSNDPPNSYHSGDLFEPHPVLSEAWKFIGRRDDRVTMINGEKVLPVPIEDTIRQSPLVKEAVVFGNDRTACGLLIFRAAATSEVSNEELLSKVWPLIEKANSQSESFAQLSKDYIEVMPSNADYPATDKGSIQRAKIYNEFAHTIDSIYARTEKQSTGTLALAIDELEGWLQRAIRDQLHIPIESVDVDLYASGMDSLKAIHLRSLILNNIDIGQQKSSISQMFVLEQGRITRISRVLYRLRVGLEEGRLDTLELMKEVIERYNKSPIHRPEQPNDWKESGQKTILLTGSTGGLGHPILVELLNIPSIEQVWCHVRAASQEKALARLRTLLAPYAHTLPSNTWSRVVVFTGPLDSQHLGLTTNRYHELQSKVTHIIHAAYPVNFILPLESFMPHIVITYALLAFAQSTTLPHPAKFIFCSSVSVATSSRGPKRLVVSTTVPHLSHTSSIGYAQSKLVCEHIISNAIASSDADALILRIGQLVPSPHPNSAPLWNPNEAIPLIIRSALITGYLPDRLGSSGDACSWLPIATAARAVVQLGGLADNNEPNGILPTTQRNSIYNLLHPNPLSWCQDVLPSLHKAGLEFKTTDFYSWLTAVRASDPDPESNPSIKLLAYWEKQQDGSESNSNMSGDESGRVRFDTSDAERDSVAIREAPDLMEEGYIEAFVKEWRKVWGSESARA